MLSSASRKTLFSAYVDRTVVCQSAKECLQAALKNPAYDVAKDLEMSTEGPFAVARFFIDTPQKVRFFQANVVASAYVDGQWFDVHISAADKERPDMEALLRFLRQIEIK
jgi:hypothetical protein